MSKKSKFMTTKQVAEYLNISTTAVYQWAKNGSLDGVAYNLNGSWRFDANKLEDWVESKVQSNKTTDVKRRRGKSKPPILALKRRRS